MKNKMKQIVDFLGRNDALAGPAHAQWLTDNGKDPKDANPLPSHPTIRPPAPTMPPTGSRRYVGGSR